MQSSTWHYIYIKFKLSIRSFSNILYSASISFLKYILEKLNKRFFLKEFFFKSDPYKIEKTF